MLSSLNLEPHLEMWQSIVYIVHNSVIVTNQPLSLQKCQIWIYKNEIPSNFTLEKYLDIPPGNAGLLLRHINL